MELGGRMDLAERSCPVVPPGDGRPDREDVDSRVVAIDRSELTQALTGDAEAFRRLTEDYGRELHLHCYRMLGSFHDAEDGVQETLIRAWRYLPSFEGRSSFRAWLYRIATNVCLTRRPRHSVPLALPKAVESIAYTVEPAKYLSPYPDVLLDELQAGSSDPASVYDLNESVQLAFLAAVQLLPPRQRAVLILHDVVGFTAAEVADALDATMASVNSALGRARATLAHERAVGRLQTWRGSVGAQPTDEVAASIARCYVEAWQAADIAGLVGLLKRDVVMTMPPRPVRYAGRESVIRFLVTIPSPADRRRFRFILTRANRQPALAAYRRDPDGDAFLAWGMFVLGAIGDAIAEITAFGDPTLLRLFGLPDELDDVSPTTLTFDP
jgi:RNA polymerase sigma-70 factor (ECF subfamily)